MDIGEQRRTIYVEPVEEPLDERSPDPGHEERPIEPVRTLEPQPTS